MFIVLQQKSPREPNTIWREGTHEGKKGKSKNENTLLQRVKMGNCLANTPEALKSLQIREICYKFTCNGPIKTKYFLYKM